GWFVLRRHDVRTDKAITSQVLPQEDKAEVIIDAPHHEIITITRKQNPDGVSSNGETITSKAFLDTRAKIEIRRDGTVAVTQRKWGTEFSPFIGTSFDSDVKIRTSFGINAFYVERWELGAGLSLAVTNWRDARVFVGGSYNVYGNILLTAAIDNHKAASVGVALKF